MNLLALPTDISSKDVPLREDIRLLGRILGNTLREQEGDAAFDLVENVRKSAVRFRKTHNSADRDELERLLHDLSPRDTLSVVRAFSCFSQLSNIAEDLHHNRRRRAHQQAGSKPQEGSILLALERLQKKNQRTNPTGIFQQSAHFTGPYRTSDRSPAQKHPRLPPDHFQPAVQPRPAGHDAGRAGVQRRGATPLCVDPVGYTHAALFQAESGR